MKSFRGALAVLFCLATQLPAAPPAWAAKGGDPMTEAHLRELTLKLTGKYLDGATTGAAWKQKRERLHREYLDMLGLWPLPERTPLQAKVVGSLEKHGVVVEKLHFQSKPGLYVTGNLYRPKKVEEKLPTILYVCGHSGRGRDGNKTAFQDHGFWFANNGYVCLIIDTLQLGEIAGKHHGTYNLGRFWWFARGYTPAGVECWNGIRALDYLLTRPEVDPERIGVTGISGGGAATLWIAAADERVKVAVPVSGMSDLETYVLERVVNGHCDCMFLNNTFQWEWTTIAALVAPRPMLFANSDADPIFPMPANRRIFDRLRLVYRMLEKPDNVDEYVSAGGHAYRPDLRVAIFKFLNLHLKGERGEVKDADFEPLPGKELRAFPDEGDLPADALNDRIDESFVPLAKVAAPTDNFGDWQADLLRRLRDRSFRSMPDQPVSARRLSGEDQDGVTVERLATDAEIVVPLIAKQDGKGDLGTLLVRDREDREVDERLLKQYGTDGPVRIVTLRPGGNREPPNFVDRAYYLLGRSVDAGRVQDVVGTVRYLHDNDSEGRAWRVIGRGPTGVIAAYAALFEPAIAELVLVDPPASHREGPIFPNVLQVLDIPDALGLLAPRPLALVGAKDAAFDRTAAIYRAAKAGDKLSRK